MDEDQEFDLADQYRNPPPMENLDWAILRMLVERPGTFVYPVSKESICAFVNGYEHGRQKRGMIGGRILKKLCPIEVEEGHVSTGLFNPSWQNHLDDYVSQNEIDWFDAFVKYASEVLEDGPDRAELFSRSNSSTNSNENKE